MSLETLAYLDKISFTFWILYSFSLSYLYQKFSLSPLKNVYLKSKSKFVLEQRNFGKLIEEFVKNSGAKIIAGKGATFYAISTSVCHICKCLLSGIDTTMTVSTMLHGEYGLDDVCMSLLTVVGHKGAHNKVMLPLTENEIKALHKSSESLKNIIRQTKI